MAKPTLALIPSAIGGKLYSVLPSDGSGDFDFTRATTATRINKDGLIETVASGDSRLNYPMIDGKVSGCPHHLLEPQRTNLITYSEDFTQWNSNGGGVTINQTISPNGTLNADKLFAQTNNGQHRVDFYSSNASGATTFSFFAKSAEYNSLWVRIGLSTAFFNLENGESHNNTTATTSSSKYYGDGWYRCMVTKEISSANEVCRINLTQSYKDSADWTGDGTSGLYVWGAMFEQGSYATSYIPTNESAATRDADTGVPSNKGIQTGDISSYVDGSNGVFYFEGSFADFNVVNRISLSNSTGGFGGDYISIATNHSGSTEEDRKTKIIVFYRIETPSSTGTEDVTVNDARDNFKMAISWDGTTLKGYINGVEFFSNSETAFGGFDRVYFSRADNNIAGVFHGKQKDLRVYDTALTDAELVTLTSWTSFDEMANALQYKTL